MKGSRLQFLLDTLDKKELGLLQKWICSPFFNQRQDVVELFGLYRNVRRGRLSMPDKQELHRRLFPGQDYEDQPVRLVMSLLYRQCCQFLVYQKRQEEKTDYQLDLVEIFRNRKLHKLHPPLIQRLKKNNEQRPYRNKEYFQRSYAINLETYEYERMFSRTKNLSIQAVLDNLEIYNLLEQLTRSLAAQSHINIWEIQYDTGLIKATLAHLENRPDLLKIPAISLHYCCYQLIFHSEHQAYFEQYKKLLKQHQNLFSKAELTLFYIVIINYCVKQTNFGKPEFMEDVFWLSKEELRLNLANNINFVSFRTKVSAGLYMKDFEWVQNFIKQYGPLLPEEVRDSTIHNNLARLRYLQKDYQQALDHLQHVFYKDIRLMLSVKTLTAEILYDLKEIDVTQSHLTAMMHFIRRNKKLPAISSTNYKNFILFFQKLIMLNPYDKEARKRLKQELHEKKHLTADFLWLDKRL